LVLFQRLFSMLDLKRRLRGCFGPRDRERSYGLAVVVLQLIVHVILGFRRLRDRDYYAKDPLVCRLLGVKSLPDVGTISRTLASATMQSVERVRGLMRTMVLDRLRAERLSRVTLDFDGSVMSTKGRAEGSAVGFNPKKRGARSYYPLFCTVSQVSQFLDMLHRPGNVHDSHDAVEFIEARVDEVREALPSAVVESRLDAAFFSDETLSALERLGVEYTVSVPFERMVPLRYRVDSRLRWNRLDDEWSYFEIDWKPKTWPQRRRFIAVRHKIPARRKGPLQLDLFEPRDRDYDYRVIVTNKTASAKTVMKFHHGRGIQEGLIGEAKHWAQLDYVPCRRLVANQLYACSSLLAHNLTRELQMRTTSPRAERSTPTRAALWAFSTLGTLQNLLVRRAGALTRPQGRLTMTVSATDRARDEFEHMLHQLQAA